MKAGREHLVPLTQTAIEALGPNGEGLVFQVNDKEPSTNAMLALLKRKKVTWTVHGVRSTLRDFCTETGVSTEVSESILAHTFGDKTLRAYARSTLVEQKREVLLRWAAVLDAPDE
jgi:integrase